MKWFVLSLLLLGAVACHKTIQPATPVAAAALTADAIVVRLNEFQATLIQWCGPAPTCAPGSLDTNTFRNAIGDLIIARSALKAVPQGWQATVKTAWASVKLRLGALLNPNSSPYPLLVAAFVAVDALITAL